MELILIYRLELRLKAMMSSNTRAASPTWRRLPKLPSACAAAPPPQAVIPTFIRLIPMRVTTIPEMRGVMILLVYFKIRLMNISTVDAAMQEPKISGSPPIVPAAIMGPIKEKLVPWMQSNPVPNPPNLRHWMNVEMPEANNAMDTR